MSSHCFSSSVNVLNTEQQVLVTTETWISSDTGWYI
ncbi:hypothetical protein GBAR_LOCUS13394 [Geodia barretti]|uniref:Uncharacterized protein n=1 Tax=Geodia barretti TaxID=519541 RepID=A0AA35WJP1_GEOBA|nr:hypothetical protein GBAR_LOCUS13394 [Geodia barretti]